MRIPTGRSRRRRIAATLGLALLPATLWSPALAQSRLERSGVTLRWKLELADMHGRPSQGGGQAHHLVLALYDSASGRRIEDAVVRAQLSEAGIVQGPAKVLQPMKGNGQSSYGEVFVAAKAGPYRFRVWVRLPQRGDEIQFAIQARSPHRIER